jgi:hypothetical protein
VLKFNIYNSVIDTQFKDVCFFSELTKSGVLTRNINLVYAANASGKSTFATIMENYFNSKALLVNKFTNKTSSVTILENPNGIDSVYRYDRLFATKSAEIYGNELIISPKNAQLIVIKKNEIDSQEQQLLIAYKNSDIYKQIRDFPEQLKGTNLQKFTLKKYNSSHASEIYNLLSNQDDVQEKCYGYSLNELIDFSLNNIDFLKICQGFNEETLKIVKESFPDIDHIDVHFLNEIYNYMKDFSDRVVDKLCLMCEKTIITNEILKSRLEKIKRKLDQFQKSLETNEYFKKLNEFIGATFVSNVFRDFQKHLYNKKNDELMSASLYIANELKGIDLEQVKKYSLDCVMSMILSDKDIAKNVSYIKELTKELAIIKKENKKILNNETKDKFIDNLKALQFKYCDLMNVELKDDGTIGIKFNELDINSMYNEVLSESEKSILSFSLFLAIIKDYKKSAIIIDDPIDSHDQKNKWFILDKIHEYFADKESLVIIFTHDLDVSKSLNMIDSQLSYTNYILTKKEITLVVGPSLFFQSISGFVFGVKDKIESAACVNNEKYILPIAILLRYICKDQYKLLNEVNNWHPTVLLHPDTITRKKTKDIGFTDVSNKFVHYDLSIDSAKLVDDLFGILKILRKTTVTPRYICHGISTDDLIESNINDITPDEQYKKDIIKLLTAILIRNILEKKILSKISKTVETKLSEYVDNYLKIYGASDKLFMFYKSNKFMVDEFAHLESGVDALLTYEIEFIQDKLIELKSLV